MLSSFFVFFVDLRRKEVRLVDDVFFEEALEDLDDTLFKLNIDYLLLSLIPLIHSINNAP